MAWYPEAIRKPVDRYKPGGSMATAMPHPRRLCLHTAVSSNDSLFGLFNTPGNAVAHFYIRENGGVEQYVSTNIRASANLEGNPDTISVESWDDAGHRRTWSDAQIEAIAKLAVWIHQKHDIPLQRCPHPSQGHKASPGTAWVSTATSPSRRAGCAVAASTAASCGPRASARSARTRRRSAASSTTSSPGRTN